MVQKFQAQINSTEYREYIDPIKEVTYLLWFVIIVVYDYAGFPTVLELRHLYWDINICQNQQDWDMFNDYIEWLEIAYL